MCHFMCGLYAELKSLACHLIKRDKLANRAYETVHVEPNGKET